jgi:hypothetical protein
MEFTDLIDVTVWRCPRRGVAVVECLAGITGYALMVVVPEPVGSGHATVEYEKSPIDSSYPLWYMLLRDEGFDREVHIILVI